MKYLSCLIALFVMILFFIDQDKTYSLDFLETLSDNHKKADKSDKIYDSFGHYLGTLSFYHSHTVGIKSFKGYLYALSYNGQSEGAKLIFSESDTLIKNPIIALPKNKKKTKIAVRIFSAENENKEQWFCNKGANIPKQFKHVFQWGVLSSNSSEKFFQNMLLFQKKVSSVYGISLTHCYAKDMGIPKVIKGPLFIHYH